MPHEVGHHPHLKNLVGINGHKDYLPHFCYGGPSSGGDEYQNESPLTMLRWSLLHRSWELERGPIKALWHRASQAVAFAQRVAGASHEELARTGGGSWHGNDTLWRTILDLNRTLFYFDRQTRRFGARAATAELSSNFGRDCGRRGRGAFGSDANACGMAIGGQKPTRLRCCRCGLYGL